MGTLQTIKDRATKWNSSSAVTEKSSIHSNREYTEPCTNENAAA